MINVKKMFPFLSSQCCLKEIEFSVFLSSHRNTRESLGELEKAVETLAYSWCPHSILVLPNVHEKHRTRLFFLNSLTISSMFDVSNITHATYCHCVTSWLVGDVMANMALSLVSVLKSSIFRSCFNHWYVRELPVAFVTHSGQYRWGMMNPCRNVKECISHLVSRFTRIESYLVCMSAWLLSS